MGIVNTFSQISHLEAIIAKNIKNPVKISFWAQIKLHLYLSNINESISPLKRIGYLSVGFLVKAFVKSILYFPKVFRSDTLVFVSGRKDEIGNIKYTGEYIQKKSFLIHYDQIDIEHNVFYLHPLKILIYILSFFCSRIDIRRKNIDWIKTKIILNTSLYFDEFMLARKYYEFRIWSSFWRLFLSISQIKKIYFTSNNFFLPLIYVCDRFYPDIKCVEIAHALTHLYHPSYSYCFESRKYILPHVYIENKYSFNSPVIFPYDLELIEFDVNVKKKDIDSGLIVLIGQPGVANFSALFEIIKSCEIDYNIRYIKHPLESEKGFPYKVLNLSDLDFANDKRHTVIGFSSNLLIEMYYEGHDVYSIDKMYAHVFETRSEKIQYLSLKDFKRLIKA